MNEVDLEEHRRRIATACEPIREYTKDEKIRLALDHLKSLTTSYEMPEEDFKDFLRAIHADRYFSTLFMNVPEHCIDAEWKPSPGSLSYCLSKE